MNEEKHVIKTLNEFLKGQYMGIHAYEHLISKVKNPEIKKEFQKIQQDHKQHASIVAERIQNIGGTPVNSEGVVGAVQGFISQYMMPNSTEEIVKSALKGESYYGVEVSEEIVKGDLDEESKQLIEEILNKDRDHVKQLTALLH